MWRRILVVIILSGAVVLSAQTDDFFADDGFFDEDTSTAVQDTIVKGNTFFSLFKGDPGKAALYSLVLPGGGQIYNRSWWKVPIAIGIDFTTIYALVHNTRQYNKLNEGYLRLLNEGEPYLGFITDVSRVKNARDQARKYREYSYIYLIAGHLITVFDAFVDNHLKDFDVSDDLSLQLKSDQYGPRISLCISLSKNRYRSLSVP